MRHYQYEQDYLDVYAGLSADPFMAGYFEDSVAGEEAPAPPPAPVQKGSLGLAFFGLACVAIGITLGIPMGVSLASLTNRGSR